MIKPYHAKSSVPVAIAVHDTVDDDIDHNSTQQDFGVTPDPVKLNNSKILADLGTKVTHLTETQSFELTALVNEYRALFPDTPGKACGMTHDVDVGDAPPIKQYPYRVSPQKRDLLRQEVDYMLKNGIIEPSVSQWASPCILVPKPDKTYRFCTDYRAVNKVTKD